MNKSTMPVTDYNPGFAGHGGVNRVLREVEAEYGVGSVGRHSANHVARIKILYTVLDSESREMTAD